MSRLLNAQFALVSVVGLLSVGIAGCGPGMAGNGNGYVDSGNGNGGGDGGSVVGNGDGGYSGPTVDAMPCAATMNKAEQVPLDMYIMLDQSGSMADPPDSSTSTPKWDSVTSALESFVGQPGLDGISVGLQYFGLGSGFFGSSCTASDYAKPDVEIAPLTSAQQMKITSSIGMHSPTTDTPTIAALQGAVDHATTWEKAHPDHVTIVVLATDGEPASNCDDNLSDIDAVAAKGVSGTPKILTFVIGIGSSLSNLNGIAKAGGTGQAFIVGSSGGNVNQQFLAALNKIRGTALGCVYKIPMPTNGQTVNYDEVAVEYTPGDGSPSSTIPRVNDKSKCPSSGDGWYYDNNTTPTTINLCTSTCNTVTADTKGQINILTGCSVVVQ